MYELKTEDLPIETSRRLSIWIVTKRTEIIQCQKAKVPYLVWRGDKENLIKQLIFPLVSNLFPDIKWKNQWGLERKKAVYINVPGNDPEDPIDASGYEHGADNGISDIASSDRHFSGHAKELETRQVTLGEFYDDDLKVDVEKLMNMELLPSFMTDIVNSIIKPLEGTDWMEGYNKKRGLFTGNYKAGMAGKNLIILDVSASIPRGVSSTMLAIIATLADRCNADLIVTAARSELWRNGEEIPSPQELRDRMPLGNESYMFHNIITNELNGACYDNVIVFGDNDRPIGFDRNDCNIKVNNLLCYHLWSKNVPGYGKWVEESGNNPNITYDTLWVQAME